MRWKELVGSAVLVGSMGLSGCGVASGELLPDGSAPVVDISGLVNNPSAFVGRRVQVTGFSRGVVKSPDNKSCLPEKPVLVRRVLAADSRLTNERGILVVEYCVDSTHPLEDPAKSAVRPVWVRGTIIERAQTSPRTTHTFVAETVR